MATEDQLKNAEEAIRDVFPAELAEAVIADNAGTNPFGALAFKLARATRARVDPVDVLEEFLERSQDPRDGEVASPDSIAIFHSPTAYVASRIEY